MTARTLLAILPGSESTQRVAVMLVAHGGLELQHQSWGDGVGWYVQSTIILDGTQAEQLRNMLGLAASMDRPAANLDENPHGLRICAESA